jgi:hypothetical protein
MVKITKDIAFKEYINNENNIDDIFPLRFTPKVSINLVDGYTVQSKHHKYEMFLQWRCNHIGVLDSHTADGIYIPEEQLYEDIPYTTQDAQLLFNNYFEKYSTDKSHTRMTYIVLMENGRAEQIVGRENRYIFKGFRCKVDVVYFDMNKVPYPTPYFGYEVHVTAAEVQQFKSTIETLTKQNKDLSERLETTNSELNKVYRNRNYLKNRLTETKKRMKTTILEIYQNRSAICCGICMNDILCENLLVTNCCHMFCKGCVDNWTNSGHQNSATCPECRMKNYLTE